jgi:hypothetical protein
MRERVMLGEIIRVYMEPCDDGDWPERFAYACMNAGRTDAEHQWVRDLILEEWNVWINRTLPGFFTTAQMN